MSCTQTDEGCRKTGRRTARRVYRLSGKQSRCNSTQRTAYTVNAESIERIVISEFMFYKSNRNKADDADHNADRYRAPEIDITGRRQ